MLARIAGAQKGRSLGERPPLTIQRPTRQEVISLFQEGTAMLVLTRRLGERILIGDQIEVTVVRIGSGVVRIGVDAPAELTVMRPEFRIRTPVARTSPTDDAAEVATV